MKAKSNMVKSYPYLSRALGGEDGFDPTNPSVKRSMRGLLTELNELLSTEYQLDVNGISNKKISYVRVPRTQSDRSFLNSKEWVDTAMEKWRTGSSASINGGCNSAGNFAPCRTPLFARLQERRQLLATPILMCLLKWMRRTRGTSENCQKKG
jgi:hypothetical protein